MDKTDDKVLPSSVQSLYTDGSFHIATDSSPSSMASAWLALDDDGFILESSSLQIPSCFPSALRSEIYAVVLGLNALSHGSSISVYTDCIPAHGDDIYNAQVDSLAKASHLSSQPTNLTHVQHIVLKLLNSEIRVYPHF
ncbi:hypothetical protein GLOIN_2v1785823 [Rhizophagus irregularis DAOM 181602=DAOM 197198]|nr:hypothetical protein GLOIN_2v1785823 [Rhizophagus irregularis DAOM 181602=DAOM 197198]